MNQYPIWIGMVVALLMVCLAPNPLWWMILALGAGANGVVIAANGWKMPAQGLTGERIRHVPMTASTRRRWLGDVIPTGFGKASVGDVLIAAGIMGGWATRGQFVDARLIALLCIMWWGSGWTRGFRLFDKWPKEARRDARKNIPIVLVLMLAGNLLRVRGCSTGELHASVDGLAKGAIAAGESRKPDIKPQPKSKWRDLGTLATSPKLLKRLRVMEAEQAAQEKKRLTEVLLNLSPANFFTSFHKVGGRKGPFCRVTCNVHHGSTYDVEVAGDYCRAGFIPKQASYVPGWNTASVLLSGEVEDYEYQNDWPGPGYPGAEFQNYKLYWK